MSSQEFNKRLYKQKQEFAAEKINDALSKIPYYWADEKRIFIKNQTCVYPHYLRLEHKVVLCGRQKFCELSESIYIVHFEKEILYVGKTKTQVNKRINQHKLQLSDLGRFLHFLEEKFISHQLIFTVIECFNFESSLLEALLINELDPLLNKRKEVLEKELSEEFRLLELTTAKMQLQAKDGN